MQQGATGGHQNAAECSRQQATGLQCMQHMQEPAGTITTMLNTEICCKFGRFVWPTLSLCRVRHSMRNFNSVQGHCRRRICLPLKAGTDTENAAKRQQEGKARQGKDVAKKRTHPHTHTQTESRQEGAAAVESDVRSTLRQSLLRLTLSLSLSLAFSLSLELRHCSSSTFTHTHSPTGEERKGRKKGNRKT